MPRKRNLPTESAVPLRKSRGASELNEKQEHLLSCLAIALVVGYNAVYLTRFAQSGAVRIKIYAGGEAYEDVLDLAEEWEELLDDYAKQLGVQPHYRELVTRPRGVGGSGAA